MYCCLFDFFFFFKQKTAYEMRISDWSSDVCSSDLGRTTCRSSWLEACGFWCNRPIQLEAAAAAVRAGLHQAHPHRFAERQFRVGFDARQDRRFALPNLAATLVLRVDTGVPTPEHLAYAQTPLRRLVNAANRDNVVGRKSGGW